MAPAASRRLACRAAWCRLQPRPPHRPSACQRRLTLPCTTRSEASSAVNRPAHQPSKSSSMSLWVSGAVVGRCGKRSVWHESWLLAPLLRPPTVHRTSCPGQRPPPWPLQHLHKPSPAQPRRTCRRRPLRGERPRRRPALAWPPTPFCPWRKSARTAGCPAQTRRKTRPAARGGWQVDGPMSSGEMPAAAASNRRPTTAACLACQQRVQQLQAAPAQLAVPRCSSACQRRRPELRTRLQQVFIGGRLCGLPQPVPKLGG